MSQNARTKIWPIENSMSEKIPYTFQLDSNSVKTEGGDILQVIKVGGLAHECADESDIINRRMALNTLLKNIARPDISIWTHTIRRELMKYPTGSFEPGFASELNAKYKKSVTTNKMMVNELYITVILRPHQNKAAGFFSRLERPNKLALAEAQQQLLEQINDVISMIKSALKKYDAEILTTYEHNGVLYSEPLEFLSYLVNGEWQPVPVPRQELSNALPTSRIFFGGNTLEIKTPERSFLGGTITIKEYPEYSQAGMLNPLLTEGYEFILAQSFTFIAKPNARELLKRQQNRMISAGDLAESQIMEIDDALDDLESNRFVMGHHHITLTIFADTAKSLKQNLSDARTSLLDLGMVMTREDIALEAAWWAQLPANFKFRPRPAPITSKNMAGFASLHNFKTSRAEGNQWGPAVTLLKTPAGSPFYFNFHAPLDSSKAKKIAELEKNHGSEAIKEDPKQQKALANTLMVGVSGSGKTVLQAFLLAQSQKFKPTCVMFDKDRGLEIFIRAMNGIYLPLESGKRTGLNPFRLPPTPSNIEFLRDLTKKLIEEGGKYTLKNTEEMALNQAIDAVMSPDVPASLRCLDYIASAISSVDPEGAGSRLKKWCSDGPLGWVFTSGDDALDFSNNNLFGFDVTELLDMPTVRTPVVMYLFHRMEQLIDGRRFMCFMDEFWKLLLDQYFEEFAQNKLKVIRKQNGFLVLGTQSPRDVLNSPISHSIVGQCSTFIFMPDPKADRKDYIDGFKLTEKEFWLIKEGMGEESRCFLVKQGNTSAVAELDLAGFDNELAILSGTTDNVNLLDDIIKQHGSDPEKWIPEFNKRRKH